jgi:hypothetical protein
MAVTFPDVATPRIFRPWRELRGVRRCGGRTRGCMLAGSAMPSATAFGALRRMPGQARPTMNRDSRDWRDWRDWRKKEHP